MQGRQFAVRKYGEKESKVMTQDEIIALFDSLNDQPKAVVREASAALG